MLTDENYSQPVQVKIDTTGIYKMMDVPLFKDYLQRNLSSENFRSQEYVNVLNDDNLVDVINLNNKVSYSTLVNKENLVYQVLIYTKKEEKEQMLIAELTSDVEIQDFKLNKFTGTIIFKDLNLNVLGNEMFENGHSIKSYSKSICGYVTTAVSCASGRHFPGEACAYSGTSGSAYYDTEILNCSGGHAESLDPNWGGGGIGGGGGGFNPYDFSPSEALLYYLEIKGGTGFSTQQLSYLQNNPLVADSLKYYFLNDENSGSPSLLHWSVNFFIQNPNTSWVLFQNWFLTTRNEGQFGEYYDGISDDVFSQQTFQQYPLPSMANYEIAFPSKPNATYPNFYRDTQPNYVVYNDYIGGRLKQLFNQNGGNISTNPYYNACAARQSYALNKLGIMITFQHNDLKGNNDWNYILTASKMGVFLEKTFGVPTHKLEGADANNPSKIAEFLKGKTGVYLVINKDPSKKDGAGYTGHTDMIKNGYVSGGANVTNSNGSIIKGGIKHIYIWELN